MAGAQFQEQARRSAEFLQGGRGEIYRLDASAD